MRIKTILLFGIIGLVVSSPMLFNKANQAVNQTVGNQWQQNGWNQPLLTGVNNQAVAEPEKPGFFARLFGGGDHSAQTPPASNNPFQFANNQTIGNTTGGTIGTTASSSMPIMGPPTTTFSEPVYQPFANLNEFLRFDVPPNWVKNRWPRVSSFPGEDNLTGMRVALVSGPRPVDIHGSLTYYFDHQQRVQRIGFKGWTGDASELASYVEQAGFRRRDTNGAALFTRTSWGKTKGALRLDHPAVATRELPNEQLMVLFEITNPNGSFEISQQTQTILDAMETRQ